jgi:maleamate amidohydrolase
MSSSDIYSAQGFGGSLGLGQRWALLMVDFTLGFVDPALFGGADIEAAAHRAGALLAFARHAGLPVAHSRVGYADDGSDAGLFATRNPRSHLLSDSGPGSQFVPSLVPAAGELVIRKTVPSAFFGTGLAPWLGARGIDTLLVAGCTTSGCVRASVVDAISHNLRPVVVTDCVGDRAQAPHQANLFDIQQKYADLMSCDEVVAAFAELRVGARAA